MAKIHCVNVVTALKDFTDNVEINVKSFTDDDEGNKEAEDLFVRLIMDEAERDGDTILDDDISDIVMDGVYESSNGMIVITHS